ncbi:MAG: creatininase family protein [Ruthenibacterium sp.]
MRTRFLPKLTNAEVEQYLETNDVIFVPVGTVEMHGALPLDCETVISEAFALKLAEKVNGLVLGSLPYFYAGATPTGRGTVEVSVREGIDYLSAIAHSLLRQGFRRQIYLSLHGPAHMTCSPMVRDFFDDTGAPVLYLDMMISAMKNCKDLFTYMSSFNALFFGAYDMLNRLSDIPLTTDENDCSQYVPQTVAFANPLFAQAYQSGSIGYYFGEATDHAPTPCVKTVEERQALADTGRTLIEKIVDRLHIEDTVRQMKELDDFHKEKVFPRYPWVPAAHNQK